MRIWFRIISLILFCLSVLIIPVYLSLTQQEIISPLPDGPVEAYQIIPTSNPTPVVADSGLAEAINRALEGATARYGIAVINLKTGESYDDKSDQKFEAASLYKLWIMATVYDEIAKGMLTEEQVLIRDAAYLNEKFRIPTESAELTAGTVKYSIREALSQMITISHNYAALLLTEKVKLSVVRQFLTNHGLVNSAVGEPPVSTPADIALLLQKLYQGDLGTVENTAKMISLLKSQKLNHKIPKLLPPGTVTAHKTGELGSFSHDAGIIYGPKGDYIIVVMSDSPNPQAAEARISAVSKAVYEYFRDQ